MRSISIEVPGSDINSSNDEINRHSNALISLILSSFQNLTLCLSLFESDMERAMTSKEYFIAEMRALADFRQKAMPGPHTSGRESKEKAMLLRDAHIAAGHIPTYYYRSKVWIYAEGFISAADSMYKAIKALEKHFPEAQGASNTFIAANPGLVLVRDSIEHADERVQRRARLKGKVVTIPDDVPLVSSSSAKHPDGGWIYLATAANARVEFVLLSWDVIEEYRDIVADLMSKLPWEGAAQVLPDAYTTSPEHTTLSIADGSPEDTILGKLQDEYKCSVSRFYFLKEILEKLGIETVKNLTDAELVASVRDYYNGGRGDSTHPYLLAMFQITSRDGELQPKGIEMLRRLCALYTTRTVRIR